MFIEPKVEESQKFARFATLGFSRAQSPLLAFDLYNLATLT